MRGIAAGRLRERVTIEAESRVSNGQGGWHAGWNVLVSRVGAEIIGLTGDESINAAAERSVQRWRVTTRRRDDVTTKHRLDWNGLKLNIRSVVPDPGAAAAMVLICESTG